MAAAGRGWERTPLHAEEPAVATHPLLWKYVRLGRSAQLCGECQSRVTVSPGTPCGFSGPLSPAQPTPARRLPPPLTCPPRRSPVHPGRQEHRGRPEAWTWQRPIWEQKEEQGSLSWAWHLSPVKPEGQVQRKLGAKEEGALGEPGGTGSRAWQLPPFWQSWASWQGLGNRHVSPRKPGAHLGGGGTHITG